VIDCEEAVRWFKQSRHTLESAKVDRDAGFYNWSCFKSHQASEYALKGLLRGVGVVSFGHDLVDLWRKAKDLCGGLEELFECVALLNRMYIPPRYPDAWAGGAVPYESFTKRDADESIGCAERILRTVERCLGDLCGATA